MTFNPLSFRDRPDDPRSRLPVVRNAPNVPKALQPVPFTAACDLCGGDAEWLTTPGAVGELSLCKPPYYLIDCPACGPH